MAGWCFPKFERNLLISEHHASWCQTYDSLQLISSKGLFIHHGEFIVVHVSVFIGVLFRFFAKILLQLLMQIRLPSGWIFKGTLLFLLFLLFDGLLVTPTA
jgi:hypothetical protein